MERAAQRLPAFLALAIAFALQLAGCGGSSTTAVVSAPVNVSPGASPIPEVTARAKVRTAGIFGMNARERSFNFTANGASGFGPQ